MSKTIEIDGRDAIELGENSLIVFRQPERGAFVTLRYQP